MTFEKILSAGCSFIQGNELGDEMPFSQHTYPALLAKHYNVAYESIAYAGASNQGIVKKIFEHQNYQNTMIIVQWTYPSRLGVNLSYNYTTKNQDESHWFDLAPNNWDLQNIFDDSYSQHLKDLGIDSLSEQVYKHFGNEQQFLFQTKLCIDATKHFLISKNIPFLFFCTISIDEVEKFDELGFVEWCDKKEFPKGKYHHPLHEAHRAACQYIIDKKLIN